MNLNQEQLTIFINVMETGSFSATARKMGKVPSAISMAIANLELDLNLNLFQRIGREPKPTKHAIALYEKAQQLLIEMNQWKQYAYSLSEGLESSLNIVVVTELIHSQWTEYIALIAEKFPSLQINIMTAPQEDAQQMLIDQTAQLALMFEREVLANNEQFIELKREVLIPVASIEHPLTQYESIEFKQLQATRQIVIASRDSSLRPELLFSKHYWRTDNHHSASTMILANLGWGVLPEQMLNENPMLKQKLKLLNIIDFTPKFEYYVDLVWNKESTMGLAAQFLINHVRKNKKL